MLQEGDVIELKAGMRVYADVPNHFVYSNRRGDFSMTHSDITLGGEFDYLCGKYVVTKAFMGGGGQSHDGGYPDGWHVFCSKVDDENVKVDFYQSGFFFSNDRKYRTRWQGYSKMVNGLTIASTLTGRYVPHEVGIKRCIMSSSKNSL